MVYRHVLATLITWALSRSSRVTRTTARLVRRTKMTMGNTYTLCSTLWRRGQLMRQPCPTDPTSTASWARPRRTWRSSSSRSTLTTPRDSTTLGLSQLCVMAVANRPKKSISSLIWWTPPTHVASSHRPIQECHMSIWSQAPRESTVKTKCHPRQRVSSWPTATNLTTE